MAGLNIWCAICLAYVRFFYGMKAQQIDRNDLFYKSWGQPAVASASVNHRVAQKSDSSTSHMRRYLFSNRLFLWLCRFLSGKLDSIGFPI